jgi:RNA-directed DNA polymerase
VLANLFLHYAFDMWMRREFPSVPFERYADDAVVHCTSERQAHRVRAAIAARLESVGLRLHPDKTRIVYCQDANRRGCAEYTSFTFLGYMFRARRARNRNGVVFTSFLPAVSPDALKKMGQVIRRWKLHRRTDLTFTALARMINPVVRGWMRYYGAFYPTALNTLLARINTYLLRWIRKKYRRYRGYGRATHAWARAVAHHPRLLARWSQITQPLTIKMVGAGRRETVTPGSEGARRCDPSGPPDPEKYLLPEDDDP